MAKMRGLDNKEYEVKLVKKQNTNPSSLHVRARDLIKKIFPLASVYEEVIIPGQKNNLLIDFYLPDFMKAVEVQGEQHFKFNSHFYDVNKDKLAFNKAQIRDKVKRQFCELNDITLVEFRFDEDELQWKKKLLS